MTIQELFDEYAGAYKAWDNCICTDDFGCKICIEDEGRMSEIIQEVEALVRKEVVEEIYSMRHTYDTMDTKSSCENYAQSKGIIL